MNNDLYFISKDEFPLLIKFKEEANIILASLFNKYGPSSIEFKESRDQTDRIINIIKELSPYGIGTNEYIINSLNDFINFIKTGLLSPLTLSDDEFYFESEDEVASYYLNKRYPYIIRKDIRSHTGNDRIYYNDKAFICVNKATYIHNENRQVDINENFISPISPIVYITKGGIVTGDYIKICYINKFESLDYLSIPIELPISIIYDTDHPFYTIDERHPKLRELRELYNVPILNHETIFHYNIRKYVKLDK